jgi:hypothetical protein
MRSYEGSQKKKNEKEKHEGMNKVTEVGCLATGVDENENLGRIGMCVICGTSGMAFVYCEDCGEDSGAIYIPKGEGDDDLINDQSTIDSASTANVNVNDSRNHSKTKTDQDDSNAEADLCSIDKLDAVFMSNVYNTKEHINYCDDVFTKISISGFFEKIYDEDEGGNFQRCAKDYVNARVSDMELFNYHSVPAILQNICNLNFNTRLYNEHYLELLKHSQRPRERIWEFTEYERHKMIECGVEMMQQYVLDNMTMKNRTAQRNTKTTVPRTNDTFEFEGFVTARSVLEENHCRAQYNKGQPFWKHIPLDVSVSTQQLQEEYKKRHLSAYAGNEKSPQHLSLQNEIMQTPCYNNEVSVPNGRSIKK